MINRQQIEQAIITLEAERPRLGGVIVETSLVALRQQLVSLKQQEALHGERKQVTVMFADISGFTAMSEKLDPEEVRNMINRCFERLGAVIDRYEGHIDKFIGDEIMALFGAPVAHENDPERALRAALDMAATLEAFNAEYAAQIPKPLSLHFGINSGLVIAGGIGTSQRQDYSVMGDTVNLASRLEGLSEAGEILVGEDTYRLTAPLFEFEALEPVKVKGKERPVQVYRLLRAKVVPGGQIRGVEGLSSPLVGRTHELAELNEILTKVHTGQGGVISIIGEAGLGKTRLVSELQQIGHLKHETKWVEGRALSHAESASYLAVRDALRSLLGLGLEASSSEVDIALQSEIAQLFPDRSAEIYPYLAVLLEIPLDEKAAQRVKYLEGEALRQRILQATQNYIKAKTKQTPLVLMWEDLHWADPSSLGVLEGLLPLTQQCRLLLLLVYRPRRDSHIWAFHQKASQIMGDAHLSIQLPPLTFEECTQLLNNLLGANTLPEKTRRLILNKAEGNPFFVEEVIRSLLDRRILTRADNGQRWAMTAGLEDITIPDTLQGVIMARIDQLSPEAKRLLQVASVIGRTFSYEVLAQVMSEK